MLKPAVSLESRYLGAYLGLAVGDALGATVEFMSPAEIVSQHGIHRSISGGGWLRLKPGSVTDDTTMSLALGKVLLRRVFTAHDIAEAFSQWLKAKPVDVGNTVRRGIVHFRTSGKPISPLSEHDAGNGACMRCLPVALSTLGKDRSDVISLSRSQAHVTHHNQLSDAGAECVIFLLHGMMRGMSKAELLATEVADLVKRFSQYTFRQKKRNNPSGYIVDTLQAVFQAFFDTDSFESCLVDVVNRGGDADTTGAIAGMLAGCFYGVDAIPASWLESLDQHIHAACAEQASEFYASVPLEMKNKVAFS